MARRREEDEEKNPHAADFYKVTAGLTSALGVHDHGEIVSHEDMGPGFKPLHPDEQLERFGRVMYEKHEPTEEQRRKLGLHGVTGTGVLKAGPSPEQERLAEEEEEEDEEETTSMGQVTEPKALKDMDDDELWQMAQAEGLSFPRETPRNIIEGALAKHMREQEEEQKKLAAENKTAIPPKRKR